MARYEVSITHYPFRREISAKSKSEARDRALEEYVSSGESDPEIECRKIKGGKRCIKKL